MMAHKETDPNIISIRAERSVPISSIEDIIADIVIGKPVLMVDDEDRENEGDIIIAADRISPCWVRVGMPVDGPARWISNSTSGISVKYANPRNSDIKESPGPLVEVKARAPFQAAPSAAPIAASSSSA